MGSARSGKSETAFDDLHLYIEFEMKIEDCEKIIGKIEIDIGKTIDKYN